MTQRKKTFWCIILTVLSGILGLYLSINPTFKKYEESAVDIFFALRLKPTEQKVSETALVMIDEKALEDYGYYDPIPRRYIARLIDTLSAKGAHTIAIDIAFLDKLENLDAEGDLLLLKSIKRADNVVSVSIFYEKDDGTIYIKNPHQFFRESLKVTGYANLQISSGAGGLASVREVKPIIKITDNEFIPSFSSLVYCKYKNIDIKDFIQDIARKKWKIISEIPLYNESMIINYVGPPSIWEKLPDGTWFQKKEGRISTYRSSILTDKNSLPENLFKNKVVFIGNLSEFSRDQFITPYYDQQFDYQLMRGAEVQANAFLTLLNENFIYKLSLKWIVIFLLLLTSIITIITIRFGFLGEAISIFTLILSIWISGFIMFANYNLWIPAMSMTITVLVNYSFISIYLAFTEEKMKKQIKSMFQRYAPPAYVEELVKDPTKLKLGGEEKEISMIFCDIAGFTTISEELTPQELIVLLNEYLGLMTKIIFKNSGTLDRYVGDAILAVFGAPLPDDKHALNACYSAVEMQKALKKYREEHSEKTHPLIRTRIGINTGKVVFGNIGSEVRYDYTGVGDAMNLGARLESANKFYGTSIMMSEFTYEHVKDTFIVRELDLITVKGKNKPVKIYELIGRKDELISKNTEEMLEVYQEGIKFYYERRWNEAIAKFEEVFSYTKNDKPAKIHIRRCKKFIKSPPPEDWDGVFRMKVK